MINISGYSVVMKFVSGESEAATKNTSFRDVRDGAYYADAISWGAESDVVKGLRAVTFGVGTNTARGAAVTFIYRALVD